MHEITIIDDLLRTAETEALRVNPDAQVVSLKLRLGALSCASAEALKTSFDLLKADTRLENAELVIEELPLRLECRACGANAEVSGPECPCPGCGSTDTRIDGETYVELCSMELET